MSHTINYNLLPESMRDGVRRYIERGISGGGFLDAVFANDLTGALIRADAEAVAALPALARFLRMSPPDCWGDRAAVRAWIAHRGLEGIERAA